MGLFDMIGGIPGAFDQAPEFLRGLLAQVQQQGQGNPYGALAPLDGQPPQPPQRPREPMQIGGLAPVANPDAPMPPQRPQGLLASGGADAPSPQAQPMQGQGMPGSMPQGGGNPLQSIGDLIGGIYGKGGPGDGLIALGTGLMSKRRIGEGLQAGLDNMQRNQLVQGQAQLQQQKLAQQQAAYQGRMSYLKQNFPNMTPEALSVYAQNDKLFEGMAQRANPSEQYVQEKDDEGNIWSKNTMTGQKTLLLKADKEDKPQLVTVNGNQYWAKPGGPIGQPVGPVTTPGAVDQDTLAKERAKEQVKQERDAHQKAEVAQTIMPHIDRAIAAYTELGKNGAIGPTQASGVWRGAQGVFGAKNEVLRQEYEAAAKELELAKAAISMKGQGSITDRERRILALTLPRLDAADPNTGLRTLQNWKMQHGRAMQASPQNGPSPSGPQMADPLGIR